jgi:hypothetical protein
LGERLVSARDADNENVDAKELEAVERWAGERIVPPGDDVQEALAPGTAFRQAFDRARDEIAQGLGSPSASWRRDYALVFGLQRILAEERPHLASGLELRPHQVDALAGMLAALLGDAQRGWQGDEQQNGEGGNGDGAEDDADDADGEPPLADGGAAPTAEQLAEAEALVAAAAAEDDGDEDDDEPADEDEEDDEDDEAPIHDPGAVRRYRFKHPTASGKTVAAAGFVDAARITGVLILTHRRLLVDQFERDLKTHGYGHRLKPAFLRGRRPPAIPPVTVETYAWFIRNADLLNRDVYGVVLCDEAHTALGDRTAGAIRRLDTPTYIGMTATDQLLQKHVGDVFPAEIADFPLAEAVRKGVVAPLRAVRVRPGASLKRVRIVGGDFDQQELAAALDHEALNMAAAMYYADMFGNKPGIVYSAGVDHAHRVAAAMRAVGLRAAAVSGRTPPRELANTLAAYERGEINVLVNAQLLAEGWNAPRATVCMHLAPTASRRVYQQRVGRIMRLHRRKEAGVVVDFAEPTAPHTDRTVTIHSLLGVDTYHPGALVTPRSPRRRQRWRRLAKPLVREAGWCVPVTSDPDRRREIILRDWKQVAIDRLPPDEQDLWAENAGRRVGSKDLPKLARVLSSVRLETRMLFFATCAAENKNRALRLMALGDLAQNRPPANVFDRAVRLIEAAPTWRLDRAQGARTLLLALGDRRVEASDHQVVAWAWRLARASRDAQFRRVAAALDNGRDLARSLSGKSGDAVLRAATVTSRAALDAPLDVGAALLAIVVTQDLGALRILDAARQRLSTDPAVLAAALGANVPLPKGSRRSPASTPRPAAQPKPAAVAEPAAAEAVDGDAAAADVASLSASKKRRRRRRRRRSAIAESGSTTPVAAGDTQPDGDEAAAEVPAAVPADPAATPDEPVVAPKRRTRRPASGTDDDAAAADAAPAEPTEPAPPTRRRAKAAPVAAPLAEVVAAPRPRRTRRTATAADGDGAEPAAAPAPAPAATRSRRRAAAVDAPAVEVEGDAVAPLEAPTRRRTRRTPVTEPEAESA